MTRALPCAVLLMLLGACDRPQPPDPERPPEPQAEQAAETARAAPVRDAIQAPLQRAKAVEAQTRQAAEQQRVAIDAATAPSSQ